MGAPSQCVAHVHCCSRYSAGCRCQCAEGLADGGRPGAMDSFACSMALGDGGGGGGWVRVGCE
jgi:hypothetical protein